MKITEIKDFLNAQKAKVDKVMSLKKGDKIKFKLDWVDQDPRLGDYIVNGTVGKIVHKDKFGRETSPSHDTTINVQVSYVIKDGTRIDNTFTRDYLLKNLVD